MVSDKPFIQRLVKICEAKNVKNIVFSPGSRNAPLVISFANVDYFDCITIPDERVAAFYALGMAQQLQEPVIICCTSGSAALNYAPAIVEAYYQKIPLFVLTADRPVERIDQGAGQTMRQKNVYSNYIKGSFELIQEAKTVTDLHHNDRVVCEAIDLSLHGAKGPVHINVPLAEPLYDQVEMPAISDLQLTHIQESDLSISIKQIEEITDKWKTSTKKLIIFGQALPDRKLDTLLDKVTLDSSVAVISETCANRFLEKSNPCIDRLITTINDNELEDFKPDIVVSLGDAIISKKVKALISRYKPKEHWFVNEQENPQDTFGCLTQHYKISSSSFIKLLTETSTDSSFSETWHERHLKTKSKWN